MNLVIQQFPAKRAESRGGMRRAFTLIELLAVIGIIAILAAIAIPAVRALTKGNDESQSVNVVRSLISTARSIAISEHRMCGVVFFEETAANSQPVAANQTAMQIIVEAYNQQEFGATPPAPPVRTWFVHYSTARQYLPAGVKFATLTDNESGGNVESGDVNATPRARVVLFDANGDLLMRDGLISPQPTSGNKGRYAPDWTAPGDWRLTLDGSAASSPGFFLFNKAEFESQPVGNRTQWLKDHANVVIVNPNTGTVLQ